MSRDECSSLVAEIPTTSNQANLSIDERDELMKNLQKLFNTHQREELEQQPGCSSSGSDESVSTASNLNFIFPKSPQFKIPTFLQSDVKFSTLKSTILDDKLLACFVIGGECRLCFPEMVALCLGNIPTRKIDEAMKMLAIVNPLASEEQIYALKRAKLIPVSLPKCELITKTNAERLISILRITGEMRHDEVIDLPVLKVVHDCFGGCSALLYPTLPPLPCLQCRTCRLWFKPEDFCRHSHKPTTGKETCFWGFDASNWPYYIRIDDEDVSSPENPEHQLADFVQNYQNHSSHLQIT